MQRVVLVERIRFQAIFGRFEMGRGQCWPELSYMFTSFDSRLVCSYNFLSPFYGLAGSERAVTDWDTQ